MTTPRAAVTFGTVELVADIEQYHPFAAAALAVRTFDGLEAVTIQDFGFRAARQEGSLSSGTGQSPGLLSRAQLAALFALVCEWGASQPLTDTLGNAGTVKALTFTHHFAYRVPGAQLELYSYALTFRWLTLSSLYGLPYTGR